MKLSGWSRKETEDTFTLEYFDSEHAIPVYSVKVDSGLGLSVAVFGWFLPDTHELYCEHKCSLFHITAPSLCEAIQAFSFCPGLPEVLNAVDPVHCVSRITRHSVPIAPELYCDDGPPFKVKVFVRSENCAVLCNLAKEESCQSCLSTFEAQKRKADITLVKKSIPVKDKAPLASCSRGRLIASIKQQRLRCKDFESQLVGMKKEIYSNSTEINKALEDDILNILGNSDLNSTPHMNLFWQQQKKLLASPKFGRRYHPHMIRFCLSLHSKSPSAQRACLLWFFGTAK